ncbi:MAG: S-layer homology domain-containing protein [Thermodesulfovibrionales bacterium]
MTADKAVTASFAPLTASCGPFSDVPCDNWANGYISALYTAGITMGCGGGQYCVSDAASRGQTAVAVIRAKYGEDFTYTQTPYFSDVPSSHPYFKYIQKIKDAGITTVTGSYGADDPVTRDQMAAFLIRAKYGEDFTYTQSPYFSDVPEASAYFKYVQKLKDAGITTVSGTYYVDMPVTRDQMAAFLARTFLGMQ